MRQKRQQMNKSTHSTKNFTRGGQTTLHNIRMFFQIMDKVSWVALVTLIFVIITYAYFSTTAYERYVVSEYLWSFIVPIFNPHITTSFVEPNGVSTFVKYTDINHSTKVLTVVNTVELKLIQSIIAGLVASMLVMYGITRWLQKRGDEQSQEILIKGDKILSSHETKTLIIKENANSDLVLAGLPLIKNKETAHLFFDGTTGSGKSNAIKELLDQIRARGDRAIIYDKSCNFLEEFYQPNRDILLNPLDERGKAWDLWSECRDSADFDSLAAAQIPMQSAQDPFWVNAARTIFSVAAFEMRHDSERSIVKLLRYLLTADLDLIQRYLKGTEAETLVSEKTEKTAISIKSVLATYLKSLKYVRDEENEKDDKEGKNEKKAFSIRQWIQNEKAKNWLFITSQGDKHETLKPLISSWMDIAVNALLSLRSDPARRIWLILDELTSLQPLPYLTQTLSESRKFGGCVVIGIQNSAQLAKLYGQDGAREISSLLNTRFMFRQPDPDMAKWAAVNFGESIIDEVREGISYGANTMRDGISINRVESRKQLVSYSEIMSLPDLHAYVRLPGKFPVTRVEFTYKERKKQNIGLLDRVIDENKLKDVDDLIDNYTKKGTLLTNNKDSKKTKRIDYLKKTKKVNDEKSFDLLDI